MFDPERFVEECLAARRADDSHKGVMEVMARAIADPAAVLAGLGEPTEAGLHTLYRSDALTVLNLVWGPGMALQPHNHNMWAAIGLYTGREDNIFWRRLADHPSGKVEAAGAKALGAGDAVPLGRDIIHSVLNPLDRLTGALHVYGGDFFAPGRSEWDEESLDERPLDPERTRQRFAESNARLAL